MTVKNEIKIGAVVLVAVAVLYFGLNYLKGSDIFRKSNEFYVLYDEIDGLTRDSKVLLNGVKVGRVAEVKLLTEKNNAILVKLEILESSLLLPDSTKAVISSLDLLGTKGIVLKLSDDTVHLQSGDTLISELEKSVQSVVEEKLAPIQFQIEQLVMETRDAIAVVQISLQSINEAVGHADAAIQKIDHATVTIDNMVANQDEKLATVLTNIGAITGNLKANTDKINEILANVATISDSLTRANYAAAIGNASRALAQVDSLIAKVNSGEGSLGMLLNDNSLYKNLESAALEIDKLAEDLRINPERYVHVSVFGRKEDKDKKPSPKERSE